MSINFFDTTCTEDARNDTLFGICDNQDGTKAYTDISNKDKWIATIINNKNMMVSFTAIDNCLIFYKEGTTDKESTCDGMITFSNGLFLIELKKQRKEWISDAIEQLENTVKLLLQNHQLQEIKYKKVYACNRKHPNFAVINNERNKKFFKDYGFRIDIQATISIK